ncbi:hypothetical protein DCAR_0519325 [Daucus carota subsp. sativus]|uniref:Protodermal factor 1 n=1 Tax=Daucus carota subsp. sativus TaxID=79200 RepID=A0AAF0X223_DAUCS|nr:hypothetical protein DCAR_0519325 [Daucus carota subsp. sativus]
MARDKYRQVSLLVFGLIAGLISQNLVIPVMSAATLEDQKTYYSPDPHGGNSSHHTPSHGSGGGHGSSPHHHKTPSHGSSTPSNCGTGTPSSGGHHHSTPTHVHNPPTATPSTPSTPTHESPPIIDPGTPTPTYGSPPTNESPPTIDPVTPSTPTYGSPPTTESPPSIAPETPSTPSTGSPPTIDPKCYNLKYCSYWSTHPTLIWGLFGFYGTTLAGAFGLPGGGTGFGPQLNLVQALSNTRNDGYGALYREGAASLLNSMAIKRFPFTTNQVRNSFISSLGSNLAAAEQARKFQMANEGQLKLKN